MLFQKLFAMLGTTDFTKIVDVVEKIKGCIKDSGDESTDSCILESEYIPISLISLIMCIQRTFKDNKLHGGKFLYKNC